MSPAGGSKSWVELFPDEDYRFNFGIQVGDAAAYFSPTADHERLCGERRRWLAAAPSKYAALLPEGAPLLRETIALARQWNTVPDKDSLAEEGDPFQLCLALGREWEPDFLLLKAAADGRLRLLGGSLCFPSSWRLEDKLGHPLDFIHAPVPGLAETLGRPIHAFLSKLRPGPAWCRSNWSLSRSAERNYHLDLARPRLLPPLREDEVFVRIEQQALVALPESQGVLFGIRLLILPLAAVRGKERARRGLLRALRTMPEPMADYKAIGAARTHIIAMLQD